MRRDELYLVDMLDAVKAATVFVSNVEEKTFEQSDLIQSAVLQKLMVLGEAAGRVSLEVRARWPALPWRSVIGFRNIAIHAYFEIDWLIVWRIATVSLVELSGQLMELLRVEFPLIADQLGETS
jgi:uncharacterized protein with HEPN domain